MIEREYSKDLAQGGLGLLPNVPTVNAVYRHYKGGLYVVLAVGIKEDTGEPMVAYRSNLKNTTWFRTIRNWTEDVEHEGVRQSRFRRVDT